MSDNKKYYYLKLKEGYFDQDHIKVIESMENGYIYSLILLKLYLKSLKGDGCLKINERIPYSPQRIEMLAKVIGHDPDHTQKAIALAQSFEMIEIVDGREMWISDIQNFIGQSSTEGDRKREYRNKIKNQPKIEGGQMSDVRPPELELEKELEKELNNKSAHPKKSKTKGGGLSTDGEANASYWHKKIISYYNELWKDKYTPLNHPNIKPDIRSGLKHLKDFLRKSPPPNTPDPPPDEKAVYWRACMLYLHDDADYLRNNLHPLRNLTANFQTWINKALETGLTPEEKIHRMALRATEKPAERL